MFKKANNVFVGDRIRTLRGTATVKFIRWFENDFQARGYFVLEFLDGSAEVSIMYQTEQVGVLSD